MEHKHMALFAFRFCVENQNARRIMMQRHWHAVAVAVSATPTPAAAQRKQTQWTAIAAPSTAAPTMDVPTWRLLRGWWSATRVATACRCTAAPTAPLWVRLPTRCACTPSSTARAPTLAASAAKDTPLQKRWKATNVSIRALWARAQESAPRHRACGRTCAPSRDAGACASVLQSSRRINRHTRVQRACWGSLAQSTAARTAPRRATI